ncbi:MAG: hypothetical protein Q6J74_09245, partial [Gloeomargarita sp. DG02_1_bins_92]
MLDLLPVVMSAPDLMTWLETTLAPANCTAQGVMDGTQLRVLVEANPVPTATQVMGYLRSGLPRLGGREITSLLVFGRVQGEAIPRWAESLTVTPAMRGESVQERLARLKDSLNRQSQLGQRFREQIGTVRPP